MIKALLLVLPLILPLMGFISCANSPQPVSGSDGYVGHESSTWHAWTNDMPMGPRSLHVVGEVTLSNGRYSAIIEPLEETSGVHCRVVVRDRGGMGTTALKEQKVHFVKSRYSGSDESVTIHFPDETTLDVRVQSAQ